MAAERRTRKFQASHIHIRPYDVSRFSPTLSIVLYTFFEIKVTATENSATLKNNRVAFVARISHLVHPLLYLPVDFIPRIALDQQVRRIQIFDDKLLIGYFLVVQMNDELFHRRVAREEELARR